MFDALAQFAGIVTDYIGHALGRHGWRWLLVALLVIGIGCTYLLKTA